MPAAKKKNETYTTITGHELTYPRPDKTLGAFLARVIDAANSPSVSEGQLTELIYGTENPLLDTTILPGRGMATPATYKDPVFHVMLDQLALKRIQVGTLDTDAAAARHTVSVADAAEQLDMHTSAVRTAVQQHRLSGMKINGEWRIDPASVATFRKSKRGPRRAD